MFPQTYGTRYYGKRFPIETSEQFTASTEGFGVIDYSRVIMLYLMASAIGNAQFLPKTVGKILRPVTECTATVKKAVFFSISATCVAGSNIIKKVILSPISAVCEAGASIRKHVQKILSAVAETAAKFAFKGMIDVDYLGDFGPGDIVTIDSRTLEVRLNEGNALHLYRGGFLSFTPGEQEIVYMDEEGSRSVRILIRWRNKWL